MYFFKNNKDSNSEIRIGKIDDFIDKVKAHKYFKVAEPFLLNIIGRDKECAASTVNSYSNEKTVSFYFEEIDLTDEEQKLLECLGDKNKVLFERDVVIIEFALKFQTAIIKDVAFQYDSLELTVRKYRYFGRYAIYNKDQNTGWIRQSKQSEYKIIFKTPEEIFFHTKNAFFPCSITSLSVLYNLNNKNENYYTRLFINSMLSYLSETAETKIYEDLRRELIQEAGNSSNKINCPIKLSELKNYRTKKDLFYGKYKKVLGKASVPKNTFNKLSFTEDYLIVIFIRTLGDNFLSELLNFGILKNYADDNRSLGKIKAIELLCKIFIFRYKEYDILCEDIKRMLTVLANKSLKSLRKNLPNKSILDGIKNLMDYHDTLVRLFDDEKLEELNIEPIKDAEKIKEDRKVYIKFSECLPDCWHEFRDAKELVHESHIMENCIRHYVKDFLEANCGLYWAEINGNRYNAEVVFNKEKQKMYLRQLYGKKNTEPIKKDIRNFEKAVKFFKYL